MANLLCAELTAEPNKMIKGQWHATTNFIVSFERAFKIIYKVLLQIFHIKFNNPPSWIIENMPNIGLYRVYKKKETFRNQPYC